MLFLVLGTIFLTWGVHETLEEGFSTSYEKLLLGLILFIPGSYHSFIACMALRGVQGYNYDNLTTFESDDFFNDDD